MHHAKTERFSVFQFPGDWTQFPIIFKSLLYGSLFPFFVIFFIGVYNLKLVIKACEPL